MPAPSSSCSDFLSKPRHVPLHRLRPEFVKLRAAQYRDQFERWQTGKLSDDEFRPLRLQNGWYVQRYAPMLRVAVPYGELSSAQVRVLAKIARDYDRPDAALLADAQATQDGISDFPAPAPEIRLRALSRPARTYSSTGFPWRNPLT